MPNFSKKDISYPDTHTDVCVSRGKKRSFLRNIWQVLFSCYLRFEIRLFALLPANWSMDCEWGCIYTDWRSSQFILVFIIKIKERNLFINQCLWKISKLFKIRDIILDYWQKIGLRITKTDCKKLRNSFLMRA